jgi:hypothetical protein
VSITRADITIHGHQRGGLMLICTQCATTFQAKGSKVSAADDAADAHIEAHEDSRLNLHEVAR